MTPKRQTEIDAHMFEKYTARPSAVTEGWAKMPGGCYVKSYADHSGESVLLYMVHYVQVKDQPGYGRLIVYARVDKMDFKD